MNTPDHSTTPPSGRSNPEVTQEDSAIRDEDAFEAAETEREARDEALKLGAVPYERLKHDETSGQAP